MMKAIVKRLAVVSVFLILAVPACLLTLMGTEQGTRWLIQQVLSLENLDASVQQIEGTLLGHLSLKKIRYRDTTLQLTLESFDFDWDASALLNGSAHIRSILASNSELEILAGPEETPAETAFTVPNIPLNVFIDAVDLQDVRYKDKDTEMTVDHIQVAGELQNGNVRLTRLDVKMPELTLQGHGNMQLQQTFPMNARVDWTLRLPDTPAITGNTSLAGDLDKLVLTGTVSGAVILEYQAIVKSVTQHPSLSLSGTWQKLQWPLTGPAQVSSQEGRFNLSGTAENYRIELDTKVAAEQLPPFGLLLNGRGDTEALTIENLTLIPEQGQLDLQGRVSWVDGVGFDLTINAHGINPGDFVKDVPGSLNLKAATKGRIVADRFQGMIDITRLDGKLHGYPVSAQGKLALDADQVQIEKLVLRSEKNQVSADGRLNPEQARLKFRIDAPDLSTVWPGLAGTIKGHGSVQGDYRKPIIVTDLTADRLSFQDYAIGHLALAVDYAEALSRPSTITIHGESLSLSGQNVDRISLNAKGSITKHRLTADIRSAEVKVELGIIGGFENKRWDGAIQQFILDHRQLHRWQLAGIWPVSIDPHPDDLYINLQTGCLTQGAAAVCLSLNGAASTRLTARFDARSIGLALFKPWLPDDVSLAGSLTAEAEASKQGEALTARAQLHIPEATATVARLNEAPFNIPLSETKVTALYQQDRLTADAHIGLGGSDFIQAEINAGPQKRQTAMPLTGAARLSITDMSIIDVLVPDIEKVKGIISAELFVSGDSDHPIITGTCRLNDGSMAVPVAGISVKNIDLKINSSKQQPEHFIVTGHANSGKGALDLNGTLDFIEERGFPVRIQVQGKDFEIAKLPQAEIAVSPDLLVKQQHDRAEVSGEVSVDTANVEISEIPESAVAPSEDEVILGTESETSAAGQQKALPVFSDITIVLGDQVHFSGYGLTTRLNGKLRYTGTAKQQRMQGRVAMSDAKYKAYGQDLTLTKGEFLFNGPADNPWLNIEAKRKAVGEDVTAILRVTGPLKSPESKVSTEPSLPESEALAYLLTGRSLQRVGESQSSTLAKAAFNYGAGQLSWLSDQMGIDEFEVEEAERLEDSAVKLGKYINPDFYVGLSLGFFSNNYAVLFKQQLTKHFSLETRAGETQRIDLKYQLNTD